MYHIYVYYTRVCICLHMWEHGDYNLVQYTGFPECPDGAKTITPVIYRSFERSEFYREV